MSQPTSADLELRAARIADPGIGALRVGRNDPDLQPIVGSSNIDLKTKLAVACELRDMVETVKDPDTPRSIPAVAIAVVDILKNTEPSSQKESTEYGFRRVLIEILHRIPSTEAIRPHASTLCAGLLHVVGTDYEENAITCCKILMDVVRNFKPLTEELVSRFFEILHAVFRNVPPIVEQALSEGAPILDPNAATPSTRSFKVFAELAILVVIILQSQRQLVLPIVTENLKDHLATILVQSSAQRKAREDYEATGNFWSGVAPTVPNLQAYTDLIIAQVKVISSPLTILIIFDRLDRWPPSSCSSSERLSSELALNKRKILPSSSS